MRVAICYRVTGGGNTWYVEHNVKDPAEELQWVLHKFEIYPTAEKAAEVIAKKLAGRLVANQIVGVVKTDARPKPIRDSATVRKRGAAEET